MSRAPACIGRRWCASCLRSEAAACVARGRTVMMPPFGTAEQEVHLPGERDTRHATRHREHMAHTGHILMYKWYDAGRIPLLPSSALSGFPAFLLSSPSLPGKVTERIRRFGARRGPRRRARALARHGRGVQHGRSDTKGSKGVGWVARRAPAPSPRHGVPFAPGRCEGHFEDLALASSRVAAACVASYGAASGASAPACKSTRRRGIRGGRRGPRWTRACPR